MPKGRGWRLVSFLASAERRMGRCAGAGFQAASEQREGREANERRLPIPKDVLPVQMHLFPEKLVDLESWQSQIGNMPELRTLVSVCEVSSLRASVWPACLPLSIHEVCPCTRPRSLRSGHRHGVNQCLMILRSAVPVPCPSVSLPR